MQKDFYLTSQIIEKDHTDRRCHNDRKEELPAPTSQVLWWGTFRSFEQAGFTAACSCRLHGESDLRPGMLNLALHVGDDPVKVRNNRQRFAEAIGVEASRFTTCAQVHGNRVAVVTEELVGRGALDQTGTIAETDALVTRLADVPLLLFYADCTPVLLADPVTGAIGLAHAGWRGTAAGIARKTVKAMVERLGVRPENLLAAIGPCIGSCCYEVDQTVREQMPGYERFFISKENNRYWLDLSGMNCCQLQEEGLLPEHISLADVCTHDNHELFCSYRYENGKTGRMGVCLCRKQNTKQL